MSETVPERAAELLTGDPRIAHLATCHDERPHVAPLWYLYRDETVEVVTTGRKLADVRENPRVSLSVQHDEDGRARWGVVLRGTASIVQDEAEGRAMLSRINERYDVEEDAWSENTPVRIDVGSADYWEY